MTRTGLETVDQYVNRDGMDYDVSRPPEATDRLLQNDDADRTILQNPPLSKDVQEAVDSIIFIAEHLKQGDYTASVNILT